MGLIAQLQKKVFANKVSKGFNTTSIETEILLAYGELGEAYDAWRKNKPDFGEEIADVVIYCLGIAEISGIDLEQEIVAKVDKNEQRIYVKKNGVLLKEEML